MINNLHCDAALIIIDVQQGLDEPVWGKRNNPDAEARIAELLGSWRKHQMPIIHVRHHSKRPDSPLRPGQSGVEIKKEAAPLPEEPLITKRVNSAFIGTELDQLLRDQGVHDLVICGLTTEHCVSSTARMAGNFDYNVFVVSDATAAFEHTGFDGKKYTAEDVHNHALASLHNEFATVLPTSKILRSLPEKTTRSVS